MFSPQPKILAYVQYAVSNNRTMILVSFVFLVIVGSQRVMQLGSRTPKCCEYEVLQLTKNAYAGDTVRFKWNIKAN
jgi:hypothetical protein